MTFDPLTNGTGWLPDLMLDNASSNGSYSEWNFTVESYLAVHWGPKHLPLDVVIPITIVYILIFVSGVVGNVAVCAIIVRNPSMHTATNCYLFSLAISDLTVLLFGKDNSNIFYSPSPKTYKNLCLHRVAKRLERLLAAVPLGLGWNCLQAAGPHCWNVSIIQFPWQPADIVLFWAPDQILCSWAEIILFHWRCSFESRYTASYQHEIISNYIALIDFASDCKPVQNISNLYGPQTNSWTISSR